MLYASNIQHLFLRHIKYFSFRVSRMFTYQQKDLWMNRIVKWPGSMVCEYFSFDHNADNAIHVYTLIEANSILFLYLFFQTFSYSLSHFKVKIILSRSLIYWTVLIPCCTESSFKKTHSLESVSLQYFALFSFTIPIVT